MQCCICRIHRGVLSEFKLLPPDHIVLILSSTYYTHIRDFLIETDSFTQGQSKLNGFQPKHIVVPDTDIILDI